MKSLNTLFEQYPTFREEKLYNRFFKHADILALIEGLKSKTIFEISNVGQSYQNRSIHLIKAGTGSVKILLWSQMHGDEPTATAGLFDLLNFMNADADGFDSIRKAILEQCTLFIAPMLNPDGAEVFSRYNAQGLDINRDFLAQQSPEGRILRQLREELEPHFGFNLHDQVDRWSAGTSGNPATISVLAPASDNTISETPARLDAMRICAGINKILQQFNPEHIARFSDEFEPRAFGDNFQAAETSTILIESGGYPGDPERQFARKLVVISLVTALDSIAGNTYLSESSDDYYSIPPNEKRHFNILLRNCRINMKGNEFCADIGILEETRAPKGSWAFSILYIVEEIGDLSACFGYEEIDASSYQLIMKQYPERGNPADLILQKDSETILSIENGRINVKNY